MVEFVSYDGDFPNLCSGTLVLRIDGEKVTFPKYCMCSVEASGLMNIGMGVLIRATGL